MICIDHCPVCGVLLKDEELDIEEETYVASDGGEARIRLPFCNKGKECNRVIAANKIDELLQPFREAVGE